MITGAHARLLGAALREILGPPVRAAVAYLRCLPPELLDPCVDNSQFVVPGYRVRAVVDVPGDCRITADTAVELREDKGDATLLLVDPSRAGAGLDGIYNAAREISERELFDMASKKARAELRKTRSFEKYALTQARRLGQRNVASPWQEFDFLVAMQDVSLGPGGALARIGLWPIESKDLPDQAALNLSTDLVNRLLYVRDESRAQSARVDALLLDDPDGSQASALEQFLRDTANKSPLETVRILADSRRDLWLGRLRPQYVGDELKTGSSGSRVDESNGKYGLKPHGYWVFGVS